MAEHAQRDGNPLESCRPALRLPMRRDR